MSLNIYGYAAVAILGGLIVIGLFNAGARHNQMQHDNATAQVNAPILEQRGKDEAELAAEAAAAKNTDAAVAGAISQMCPATAETVRLMASVR